MRARDITSNFLKLNCGFVFSSQHFTLMTFRESKLFLHSKRFSFKVKNKCEAHNPGNALAKTNVYKVAVCFAR